MNKCSKCDKEAYAGFNKDTFLCFSHFLEYIKSLEV